MSDCVDGDDPAERPAVLDPRDRRGPRLANDPNKYIRRVAGNRYQCRPHVPLSEGGEGRVNLGCFDTIGEARAARDAFWWNKFPPRLKWAFPVNGSDSGKWIAFIRLPAYVLKLVEDREPPTGRAKGRLRSIKCESGPSVRLPGEYDTAEEAHEAARAWLVANLGRLGEWLTVAPAADARSVPMKALAREYLADVFGAPVRVTARPA